MKRLVILGSTGSIGVSTLDLVSRFPDRFQVVGLTANQNSEKLEGQARKFRPRMVALSDKGAADVLRDRCRDLDVQIVSGQEGLAEVAILEEADVVVSAIVGSAGLLPTLAAIRSGKTIALANKETLVMAGQVMCEEAKKAHVAILPVDSEHNGVFQTLDQRDPNHIRRVILTASGGPLVDHSPEQLLKVTPSEALQHPTWQMGAKITIDSATLMNKGLEVIEAHYLFGLPPEKIDVVIHRQSIIHSMVEFVDGSVMAQMGIPDMRIPLSYALNYPERQLLDLPSLDLEKVGKLTFESPDRERFPCLGYAYDGLKAGGTMPAVINASNEIAVRSYLREEIGFGDIPRVIRQSMDAHQVILNPSFDDILSADKWAREKACSLANGFA